MPSHMAAARGVVLSDVAARLRFKSPTRWLDTRFVPGSAALVGTG